MTHKDHPASVEVRSQHPGDTSLRPCGKSIVLVGLMGAGKSSVGKRLARRLTLPFADADDEIAVVAGCSILDIFNIYGEKAFRDCERQVIIRMLQEQPHVLATGGGAFMNPVTRAAIKDRAVSVWLRADLDTLVERTSRRNDRPLLRGENPRARLEVLMSERYPVYAEANVIVDTSNEPIGATVQKVLQALATTLPLQQQSAGSAP
ncbi:MAG: shikimate kinase [Rhodoplanes sp.]